MHISMKQSLAIGAAIVGLAAAQPALAQERSFDVPAQDARQAIPEFARQAGLQISAPTGKLRGVRTRAIKGKLDTRSALRTMIESTGLSIESDDGSMIVLGYGQQPAPSPEQSETPTGEENPEQDIVVTGTLLRGVAPVGTNVVGLSREDIKATGSGNTNDILARIPQVNSFLSLPAPFTDTGFVVNRPNIRNLDAFSGSTTLILLNGHRMVGSGVIQTTPDPGIIPPGAIERVEVVPDGGSSTYGSDAIGGVINFITRKRYDGLLVDLRGGLGDAYKVVNPSFVAGKDWGSGSAFVSYEYFWHDNIFNRDRDYVRSDLRPFGGSDYRGTNCPLPTVVVEGTTFAYPGRAPGTENRCINENIDFYPEEERHSLFASVVQDLTPRLSFDAHALYSKRKTIVLTDPLNGAKTITSANPYFQPVASETVQTVRFSYAPVFGPSARGHTQITQWGTTAGLTYRFENNWQARLQGNYGYSHTRAIQATLNTTAEAAALASTDPATALNPYDIASTSPGVLAQLENYRTLADGRQKIAEARLGFDGPLFQLPGGSVKLAFGTEYRFESLSNSSGEGPRDSALGIAHAASDRDVIAGFGELLVPIFGPENAIPGLNALQLSASARYDRYSDFGDTFNPKLGVTWQPADGIKIRGNWGTSYNAPSLGDTSAAADGRIIAFPNIRVVPPGYDPATALARSWVALVGGNPGLKPQTARTYSVGADLTPRFLSGFGLHVTYYNIDFKNAIATIPESPDMFTAAYAPFVFLEPSLAFVKDFTAGNRLVGAPSLESLYENGNSPVYFADFRRNNLGTVKTDGIDFAVDYRHQTGFGSVYADISGNYILNRKSAARPGLPETNYLATNSRFYYVANLGATVGRFNARATALHRGGHALNNPNQSRVKSFNVYDLYFSYEVNGAGPLKDLTFGLTINNIFDKSPPFVFQNGGYGNGQTLGRVFTLDITKKF